MQQLVVDDIQTSACQDIVISLLWMWLGVWFDHILVKAFFNKDILIGPLKQDEIEQPHNNHRHIHRRTCTNSWSHGDHINRITPNLIYSKILHSFYILCAVLIFPLLHKSFFPKNELLHTVDNQ